MDTDATISNEHEDVFRSLFIFTKEMKEALYNFPDIVFLDSTYKLSSSDFIVTIFAVTDSNGLTHVVEIAIAINEKKETLRCILKAFKEHHSKTLEEKNILIFMTDKDLSERDVLKEFFSNSKMHLCKFHVLQIFQRTITKTRMKITEKQRIQILKYLEKMANSRTSKLYDHWYGKFLEIGSPEVIDYFETNWNCITVEWVKAFTAENSFDNYTNNRVEFINNQLKKIFVKLRRSFEELVHKLFEFLKISALNKDYKNHITTVKQLSVPLSDDQARIYDLLTPFSARHVWAEYYRHRRMTVRPGNGEMYLIKCGNEDLIVTVTSCSCLFFKA